MYRFLLVLGVDSVLGVDGVLGMDSVLGRLHTDHSPYLVTAETDRVMSSMCLIVCSTMRCMMSVRVLAMSVVSVMRIVVVVTSWTVRSGSH